MKVAQSLAFILAAAAGPVAFGYTAGAAPVTATYQVPVPSDLKSFAYFPIDAAGVTKGADGAITICYDLPKDIAGPNNPTITLTGKLPASDGQFFTVREDASDTTGQCVATAEALTCMLHYAGLSFDPDSTARYLAAKYPNDPDLPKRVQVMKAFSGDAVGILSVDE
jgi:hypothetical protein